MKKAVVVGVVSMIFMPAMAINENMNHVSFITDGYGRTLYVGGSGPNNYTKIQNAIDAANSGDNVELFNFLVYEGLRTCELLLAKVPVLETKGEDPKLLIKSIKTLLQDAMIGSLHSSLIQSLKTTLSNPSNKKKLRSAKKLPELNKLLDKFITENKSSTKNYKDLKEKIKKFDETEKEIKFSLLLERIEKEVNYKEKIQKINEFYKKVCQKEKDLQ